MLWLVNYPYYDTAINAFKICGGYYYYFKFQGISCFNMYTALLVSHIIAVKFHRKSPRLGDRIVKFKCESIGSPGALYCSIMWIMYMPVGNSRMQRKRHSVPSSLILLLVRDHRAILSYVWILRIRTSFTYALTKALSKPWNHDPPARQTWSGEKDV